jgi:hypothetical protein
MLASAVIAVTVLALPGLALYAMRNKVRFKLSATVAELVSFNMEVESKDESKGNRSESDGD